MITGNLLSAQEEQLRRKEKAKELVFYGTNPYVSGGFLFQPLTWSDSLSQPIGSTTALIQI